MLPLCFLLSSHIYDAQALGTVALSGASVRIVEDDLTIHVQEKLSMSNSNNNGHFVFRAESAKDLCEWALALSQISSLCNFACFKSATDAAELLSIREPPKRNNESNKCSDSQPRVQQNIEPDELKRVRTFTQAVVVSAQNRALAERATVRGADFLEHKNISLISRGNVTRDHHTIDTLLDDDTFDVSLNKSDGNDSLEDSLPGDALERGPPPMLPPRRAEWTQAAAIGAPVLSSPDRDRTSRNQPTPPMYPELRDEDKAIVEYSAAPCEEVIVRFRIVACRQLCAMVAHDQLSDSVVQVDSLLQMQQNDSIVSPARLQAVASKGWSVTRVLKPYVETDKAGGAARGICTGDVLQLDLCQSQLIVSYRPCTNIHQPRQLVGITPVPNSTWTVRGHCVQIGAGCLPFYLEEAIRTLQEGSSAEVLVDGLCEGTVSVFQVHLSRILSSASTSKPWHCSEQMRGKAQNVNQVRQTLEDLQTSRRIDASIDTDDANDADQSALLSASMNQKSSSEVLSMPSVLAPAVTCLHHNSSLNQTVEPPRNNTACSSTADWFERSKFGATGAFAKFQAKFSDATQTPYTKVSCQSQLPQTALAGESHLDFRVVSESTNNSSDTCSELPKPGKNVDAHKKIATVPFPKSPMRRELRPTNTNDALNRLTSGTSKIGSLTARPDSAMCCHVKPFCGSVSTSQVETLHTQVCLGSIYDLVHPFCVAGF